MNDSLQQLKPLKFETHPTARLSERALERWRDVEAKMRSTGPKEDQAWQFDMEWVRMSPYANEEWLRLEKEGRALAAAIDSIPLKTLVSNLLEIDLVDSLLALEMVIEVERGWIKDPASLFFAASRVGHLTNIRKRREKHELLAQMLAGLGAMSADHAKELGRSSGPYDERYDMDVAKACYRSWTMDSSDRQINDVTRYYTRVFDGLRSLLGDPLRDNLMISTDTLEREERYRNETWRFKRVNVRLSFRTNDRLYQSCFTCAVDSIDGGEFVDMWARPLIDCVNKALCDIGSEVRLWDMDWPHQALSLEPRHVYNEVFLVVDRAQAEAWVGALERHLDFADASRQFTFPLHWCAEEIGKGVEDFRGARVLAHLSAAAIDSAEAVANGTTRRSWAEVFSAFPDVLFYEPVNYRYRAGEGKQPLLSLASISHGVFDPVRVKEHRKRRGDYEDLISVSFTYGGRKYKCYNEWDTMISMINRELAANNASGRFCTMPLDMGHVLVFLTKPQYDALHDKYLSDYFGAWENLPKD